MHIALSLRDDDPRNGRTAKRIGDAVMLAMDLSQINPKYRATRHTCHCPDFTFHGKNRPTWRGVGLCKHSLAVYMRQQLTATTQRQQKGGETIDR